VNSITHEYRLSQSVVPDKITSGLDALVDRASGALKRRRSVLSSLREEAEKIDALADSFRVLSDAALQGKLRECRAAFRRQNPAAQACLPQALAAIREAAERKVGLRPFNVQLMGALALRRGYLAEMATGEGKTLTATMPAILAAWTRQPCHIITVNDYLAHRDAEWLGPLYRFCEVSVGYVTGQMSQVDRARGHECDVTYTTSKEIVADFLRDRLRLGQLHTPARRMIRQLLQAQSFARQGLVMRGLHTAIIDEADSVLIDEAVTPLIISGSDGGDAMAAAYRQAWAFASALEEGIDYRMDLRYREIELLAEGKKKLEANITGLPLVWRGPARQTELVKQALTAREFFIKGKQYVVQDSKVVIVDEFTGRMMPMRRWRDGLHQMIEAKEDVEVSPRDETLARLSFQQFFRFFRHISGMTGTAQEAAAEFWHIYRLPVIAIPTNKPCIRKELPDRVFPDLESKWNAVVEEIVRLYGQNRPVLVGTRNVTASELLAERLKALNLPCSLLNATRHQEEAQIIIGAGHPGRITISTNMAGRGTDIKLGKGVAALGGLHVLATERHESHRIDRQLYGRAARQGDPGSAQAFVSVEDELIRRFVPDVLRKRVQEGVRRSAPGTQLLAGAGFKYAQFAAQRQALRQRRAVLKFDTWLSESLSFAGSAQTYGRKTAGGM
jgi:preprotein translocase subunit SecA